MKKDEFLLLSIGECYFSLIKREEGIVKKMNPPWNRFSDCNKKSCSKGFYRCAVYHYCIQPSRLCDKTIDCLLGDDEEDCSKFY